jgi:hypothetical protein
VFAWARANGWKRHHEFETSPMKSERWWHWNGNTPDERVFVELATFKWSSSEWRLGGTVRAGEGGEMGAEDQLDPRRAVDVLCALGVLPVSMFSAIRNGYCHDEWGIIEDQRERGLGFAYTETHYTKARALDRAEELRQFRPYPIAVKHRRVLHTGWEVVDADA